MKFSQSYVVVTGAKAEGVVREKRLLSFPGRIA